MVLQCLSGNFRLTGNDVFEVVVLAGSGSLSEENR